jgi:hypothetical protein
MYKKVQIINGRKITDYDEEYRGFKILCRISETNIFSGNKTSVYIIDYPVKITDIIPKAKIINYCEDVGYGLPTFNNLSFAKSYIDNIIPD